MTDWNPRWSMLIPGSVLAIAAVASPGETWAQQPQRGESVFERERPGYSAQGVRAGAFRILPRVEVGEAYNDNIFATDNNEEGDFITLVRPEVRVESDWNRHEIGFRTGAEKSFYWENNDENYLDYFTLLDGRLDVMRETFVFGGLGWRHRHEDRGSPDDAGGEEPTEYDVYSANLGAFRGLGRISTRIEGAVDRIDFHDVDAPGGNINEDDRDRTQYRLVGQVGYEYLPDTDAFVRVTGRLRDYDTVDEDGFDRSSQGFAAVVGTDLDFTGVVTGEVFAGFQHTTYDDDDEFDDFSGPAAGANVLWNVTDLTSIRGFLEGSIEETTQDDASAYLAVRTGASVEHELMRNVLLGAALTVGRDDYEGIDREDDLFTGAASARYLINRNFYAGAEYTHRTRTSDTDDEFSENVIMLLVGAQL